MVPKWDSEHPRGVAKWFGVHFRPLERIELSFSENENFEFFQFFSFTFKRILCIKAPKNEQKIDFLNFFSKMKLLIKNPRRSRVWAIHELSLTTVVTSERRN